MVGYVCYVDRFCGHARRAARPARLPGRAGHHLPAPHAAAASRGRGRNDGGYAVADYRAVDPRLGTMDDLAGVAAALREARHEPVRRPGAQPHRARAPVGPRLAGGRPGVRRLLHAFPDRTMPDAYEATINDVFPDRAPGSFTWVPEANGGTALGVDDVLPVPVGPQLRQPAGVRRHAGDDPLAGQPRHRDLPAGRRAVHVEAAGHHVHEPARGARHRAGAARAHQARRARGGLQGRGDRRARRPRGLPRRPRTATGPSASWPTTTSSW